MIETTISSDLGHVTMKVDQYGRGYRLHRDAEGFGPLSVENTLTPRVGHRGSMLSEQHEEAGDMFLPIIVRGEDRQDTEERLEHLAQVLKLADGLVTVTRTNTQTGRTRFRRAAYQTGLDTPQWESPYALQVGVTLDVPDPWAYAPAQTRTLVPTAAAYLGGWAVPFQFPLSASGTSVPSAVLVDNRGVNPGVLQVTFYGPSSNPRAWSGPVSVEYRGTLAHDEWVAIGGLDQTVLLGGGGRTRPVPVPGRLSPHTMMSDLIVPVGRSEWWYEAIDESAQSKAEFTWWDAHQSMR